ncbi:hypothetical protein VPH35_086792 [Triticum aestivum]
MGRIESGWGCGDLRPAAALGLLGLDHAAGGVGDALEGLVDGIAAADEEPRDHLRVALAAGLLELAARVGAQRVAPRHAALVGPLEQARRAQDVPVQPQRLPPRARQPPPRQGLRRVVVEDGGGGGPLLGEVAVEELVDGVGPLVDGSGQRRPRPRAGEGAEERRAPCACGHGHGGASCGSGRRLGSFCGSGSGRAEWRLDLVGLRLAAKAPGHQRAANCSEFQIGSTMIQNYSYFDFHSKSDQKLDDHNIFDFTHNPQ